MYLIAYPKKLEDQYKIILMDYGAGMVDLVYYEREAGRVTLCSVKKGRVCGRAPEMELVETHNHYLTLVPDEVVHEKYGEFPMPTEYGIVYYMSEEG